MEFWPFIPQILKPLGSVLQVEKSRVTLPHLNARVLLALAPEVNFPDNISVDLEGERICWEIALLGNLNACFHCKLNGHTKKDCLTLQPSRKEKFNVVNNQETFGLPVTGINNTNKIPNNDERSNTHVMESGSLQSRDPFTTPRLQPQVANTIDIPMSNIFFRWQILFLKKSLMWCRLMVVPRILFLHP